jgi:PIN domain nuclease of toxin-antitoxin system
MDLLLDTQVLLWWDLDAAAAGSLTWDHEDPFDRVLVVQERDERLVLVHADASIRSFPGVTQMWAASG